MTTLHLPHALPWQPRLVLVRYLLALAFALCATPTSAASGQTPPRTAVTDSFATPPAHQRTAARTDSAHREGQALGAQQGGWFGRAFAVGLLTAYIGPVVMIPIAASSNPVPPPDVRLRLAARGPEYQAAFERSYRNEVRRKRLWTSAAGSALGCAAIVGLAFAAFY